MKTVEASSLVLASLFLAYVAPFLLGCVKNASEAERIRHDHAEIQAILDKAVLSDNPEPEFHRALPRVRSYPSVDSAWVQGKTFFVRYKQGGIVTWSVPPTPQEH